MNDAAFYKVPSCEIWHKFKRMLRSNSMLWNLIDERPIKNKDSHLSSCMSLYWGLSGVSKGRFESNSSSHFPGSCDSYVKVKLLPEEKFADVKLPKTHVQKENLYPLFDEIFNMWVVANLVYSTNDEFQRRNYLQPSDKRTEKHGKRDRSLRAERQRFPSIEIHGGSFPTIQRNC